MVPVATGPSPFRLRGYLHNPPPRITMHVTPFPRESDGTSNASRTTVVGLTPRPHLLYMPLLYLLTDVRLSLKDI